jgi:tRNA(Ile)-lysidine synthase
MHKRSLAETLLDALRRYNISTSEKLIVAVSGGCDSMVLLAICNHLGLNIIAAHVNYALRGEDSNRDEQLVSEFCAAHDIPLKKRLVTEQDWINLDGSTQEKARSLRYAWLEELKQHHNAKRILTAHHANDQTETMLLQFIRGGASKSLYGMAADNGSVLRPLLAHTKNELLEFAQENRIPWREDLSNQTNAYTRNIIRHNLIPLIEQLNPSIHVDIQRRSQRMHEEQLLSVNAAQTLLHALIRRDKVIFERIELGALVATNVYHTLLWAWLQPAGFSSHTTERIANHIETGTTSEPAWYYSETHEVCLQNGIICLSIKKTGRTYCVDGVPWTEPETSAFRLSMKGPGETLFTPDYISQSLDASCLKFPLIIRNWKDGDALKPLGAPGRQKVSDLLTQLKLPAWEKKQVLVLESNHTIAAIIGIRISDEFKITANTSECLHIQFGES